MYAGIEECALRAAVDRFNHRRYDRGGGAAGTGTAAGGAGAGKETMVNIHTKFIKMHPIKIPLFFSGFRPRSRRQLSLLRPRSGGGADGRVQEELRKVAGQGGLQHGHSVGATARHKPSMTCNSRKATTQRIHYKRRLERFPKVSKLLENMT